MAFLPFRIPVYTPQEEEELAGRVNILHRQVINSLSLTFLLFFCIIGCILCWLNLHGQLFHYQFKLVEVNQRYKQLEQSNKELVASVPKITSYWNLEKIAIERLGMERPSRKRLLLPNTVIFCKGEAR